jgi:hypothetical protein
VAERRKGEVSEREREGGQRSEKKAKERLGGSQKRKSGVGI